MSMSMYVVGFRPPDEKWKKMKMFLRGDIVKEKIDSVAESAIISR